MLPTVHNPLLKVALPAPRVAEYLLKVVECISRPSRRSVLFPTSQKLESGEAWGDFKRALIGSPNPLVFEFFSGFGNYQPRSFARLTLIYESEKR